MRFGIKGLSATVLAAAALTTTACGSSGTLAGPAAGSGSGSGSGPSSPPTTAPPTAAVTGTAVTATSLPPVTPTAPTAPTTSAAPSTGAAGAGSILTADQVQKLLLTDKDDPGYTYDAAKDTKDVTATPEVLTAGGSACQTFVDAEEALSTKYHTVTEVDRALTKASEGHGIHSSVAVLPTPEAGLTLLSDLAAGLKGCKSMTFRQADGLVTMVPTAIPALMRDGEAGFVDYVTVNGKTILMVFELVHVGNAVSEVILIGPTTTDKADLQQMGATLAHLSDVQVERLKTAQGVS